jgi:hypothetical protein
VATITFWARVRPWIMGAMFIALVVFTITCATCGNGRGASIAGDRVDADIEKLTSRITELEGSIRTYEIELGRSGELIGQLRAENSGLVANNIRLAEIKRQFDGAIERGAGNLGILDAGLGQIENGLRGLQEKSSMD